MDGITGRKNNSRGSIPRQKLKVGNIYYLFAAWSGLLGTANVVPSSPNLATRMMEAILSSETSVVTGATQR
jgi:hypothetical protein